VGAHPRLEILGGKPLGGLLVVELGDDLEGHPATPQSRQIEVRGGPLESAKHEQLIGGGRIRDGELDGGRASGQQERGARRAERTAPSRDDHR
jgi:hypothetical protein